jgi:predicted nuclease with TOPRIM domain
MTAPEPAARYSRMRGPVRAVRRVLAPAALELEGEARRLFDENAQLRAGLEETSDRLRAAEERLAGLDRLAEQVAELRDGLHEARRLNLRVAELTDLVTELVLPLHDREIDPGVLRSLRADSL